MDNQICVCLSVLRQGAQTLTTTATDGSLQQSAHLNEYMQGGTKASAMSAAVKQLTSVNPLKQLLCCPLEIISAVQFKKGEFTIPV